MIELSRAPRSWPLLALVLVAACGTGEDVQAQVRQSAQKEVREQLGTLTDLDTTMAANLSHTFRAAAARTLPSVVFVGVEEASRTTGNDNQIPEPFRRFFGLPQDGQEQGPPVIGSGSGFIFDDEGHIVTNNHVVQGATRVTVRLVDGRVFQADVVGTDEYTDIAVIKIDADGQPLPAPAPLADSDDLRVGDWVLALGNPLGLDFTVTAGIISAKGRQLLGAPPEALQSFIQTDAAINPGNSGGPLIDLLGRVVGVNTAISGGRRFVGYGFAVPIDLVKRVVPDLLKYGYARRPQLGVSVSDVNAVDAEAYGLDSPSGAQIKGVIDDTPAAKAGLQVGDVVVALNGQPIERASNLTTGLAQLRPGDRVTLTIVRDRKRQDVSVTLGEFDHENVAQRSEDSRPAPDLLGFSVQSLTPQLASRIGIDRTTGVVVTNIEQYSPAARAGIREGQVILAINDKPVEQPEDVTRIAGSLKAGEVASVLLIDPQAGKTIVNYRLRK